VIIPDPAGLPGALTAGAADIYALEAGTELIIGCGCWLRREDFTSRFITAVDGNDRGTMLASIDWEAAIAALDAGELPCSQHGERRVLRLAASTAVLATPERQNIHRRWAADAHRAFAGDDSGPDPRAGDSIGRPAGWMAGIPGPLRLPSPEQLPEMGACGAVGVARQRRTPGDFVVLCYAGS
jgi:hypothetical protein